MPLRIGTRGSRLALAQADEVAGLLRERGQEIEIVPMTTAGDRGASPASSPAGTKGLFVAEITDALSRNDVDLAVHSAKDLPSEDPPGIEVAAVPQRSLPYDVLVSRAEGLPDRPVVGTSSLRRRAQLVRMHPEAEVRDLRGNVDTRLRRMAEGALDALVLAGAGLSRLGLSPEHVRPLPVDEMVPAPGQGALAIQARVDDGAWEAARAIDHPASRTAFETERRVVALLGGGCRLPLGAYAEARGPAIRLLAVVVRPDGSDLLWSQVEGDEPEQVAGEAADTLLAAGAASILADLRT
ncbi:MAG TPA: hydroxymethylbilane synthase [Actinomycetota bacterium]|jgi:hydroxymethylbilane synthase|nr:hydroxymethylbilane synthase [Actinomycetota bacterium]